MMDELSVPRRLAVDFDGIVSHREQAAMPPANHPLLGNSSEKEERWKLRIKGDCKGKDADRADIRQPAV